MLEVVEKGPRRESDKAPVLFVHGAWHGAWCWENNFLDFFADRGYRALALSLRGHGQSPSTKSARLCSSADYVADVEAVARSLPTPPVLVGHSMGGYVVQKYLESHQAPAAVLLASIPPRGIAGFLLHRFRRHPWLTATGLAQGKSLRGMAGTPDRSRESFFSEATPDDDVIEYTSRLTEEYVGRWTFDMLLLDLPKPDVVTTPLLVLGAENDGCFTQEEVRATAAAYRTEAEIFPKLGHDMMVETGWEAVAERIHTWFEQAALANPPRTEAV